jgi:hypothetical protein
MNSTQEALYEFHQLEAEQLGYFPLSYYTFCARLRKKSDIAGMLLPAKALHIKIQPKQKTALNPVRLYITSDAAAAIPADEMRKAIERHAAGDWGLLAEKEWKRNDCALRNGGRVLSVYEARSGEKFCVMTRSDRAATTVSLLSKI